jgi:hypothetical protein
MSGQRSVSTSSPKSTENTSLMKRSRLRAPPPRLGSRIISQFPSVFAQFRAQRFVLRWRGSVDNFNNTQFHKNCDNSSSTITIIQDTDGNIFGGYTPLNWGQYSYSRYYSSSPCAATVADSNNLSFLFTIKNPHNVPPRRFHLKPSANQTAIRCDPSSGPYFGNSDLAINTTNGSVNNFGQTYDNDTGLDSATFFTGSPTFVVKEIEVFEITTLPPTVKEPVPSGAIPLNSFIVSHLPAIFVEFQGKEFELLWRGSNNGFAASDFHFLCDGHANTLTVIQDTNGNIFGGFTPIPWESDGYFKRDDTLKSFIFILKRKNQTSVKRFPLNVEMSDSAIFCTASRGPAFGNEDLVVFDHCNKNAYSTVANFGEVYYYEDEDDLEFSLIGSPFFTINEIEVFEVIP